MLGHWIRHRQIDRGKLLFLTVVVLAFGGGGCLGALADLRFGPRCLSLAAAAMTIAGGLFWFLTHRGLVDLMDLALASAPRIGAVPTLMLYGGKDTIIPAAATRALWGALQGASVRRSFYPGGYHLLPRDLGRAVVIGDILAWVRDPRTALPSGGEAAAGVWLER